MKMITGSSVVDCFVAIASFLVMVLLLFLSRRIYKQRNQSHRIYFLLTVQVAFTCIFCFVFNAMNKQPAPWCHTAAVISRTLREFSVLVTVTLWLAFVDRKLYGNRKQWNTIRIIRMIPMISFQILLIVNLFTGVIFTVGEDNVLQPLPLFYVMMAVNFLLFLSSAVAVWHYDRRSSKTRFLRVSPMILSVFTWVLPQFFSHYDTGIMGFAIGVSLLYFSMVSEIRFVDEESGLYNRGYMAYLFDLALAGKNDAKSALILETEGNLSAGYRILYNVLNPTGDVIRVEKTKYLMFSSTDSRSTMQYLASLVDEAVENHNRELPEEKVRISARCRIRTPGEDSFSFLSTVMDNGNTGDEMRGILNMMSELERLDHELALAADIQISMLPTNFPAFPDRTEFDLYASMTPAKEVGGDFYDFFLTGAGHLALVIADVSGKGIPAALFMMMSKSLIRNQLMSGCSPAEALERVNRQLCERNSSMMFVTVWAAILDLSTGKGLACNAGHEHPAIRRAGGVFELVKYRHGTMVGISELSTYQDREFTLGPGDCIFVYTDGVPEASNDVSAMFGEERLTDALNDNAGSAPEELVVRVRRAVDRFADGTPQFDDITMLCVKYFGKELEEGENGNL